MRQALAWAFDFEWANKNLFYGAYTRTTSYFSNSDLASSGMPQGAELALLEPYRDKLPPELFTQPYKLPVTDGSGNNREALTRSLDLLQAGRLDGEEAQAGRCRRASGMSLRDPAQPARLRARRRCPMCRTSRRLGIDAHVRTVDPAQYQRLMDSFDFDMTVASSARATARATSSSATGPAPAPRRKAATISWACAAR